MTEKDPHYSDLAKRVLEMQPELMAKDFAWLIEKYGVTNPDLLPEDMDVHRVYRPFYGWIERGQKEAAEKGTLEAQLEWDLRASAFLVEAGFTDPRYVDEVVNEWLATGQAQAQDASLKELADQYEAKIQEFTTSYLA